MSLCIGCDQKVNTEQTIFLKLNSGTLKHWSEGLSTNSPLRVWLRHQPNPNPLKITLSISKSIQSMKKVVWPCIVRFKEHLDHCLYSQKLNPTKHFVSCCSGLIQLNDLLHIMSHWSTVLVFKFLSAIFIFKVYFLVATHKQIHYMSCATGSK